MIDKDRSVPQRKVNSTRLEYGITTINVGDTKKGPSAPLTLQRGKYETLTIWGMPMPVV